MNQDRVPRLDAFSSGEPVSSWHETAITPPHAAEIEHMGGGLSAPLPDRGNLRRGCAGAARKTRARFSSRWPRLTATPCCTRLHRRPSMTTAARPSASLRRLRLSRCRKRRWKNASSGKSASTRCLDRRDRGPGRTAFSRSGQGLMIDSAPRTFVCSFPPEPIRPLRLIASTNRETAMKISQLILAGTAAPYYHWLGSLGPTSADGNAHPD